MTTISQRSFAGGELAPALYARVDTTKYATGLRACRNFMVMRHGGAANRPGTAFVSEVRDSTIKTRLVPFVFNAEQTYVLEFGQSYMRVIKNGQQVLEAAKAISGITKANPGVMTVTSHGLSTNDEIAVEGVGGMTELNGRNFRVNVIDANTFRLQYLHDSLLTWVNTSSFGAYTSGGTIQRVYQITTPYQQVDLPKLKFAQSSDVLTVVCPSFEPREIARTGDASWTISTISFTPSIATPTNVKNPSWTAGLPKFAWQVTAVSESGEESLPSNMVYSPYSITEPSDSSPITITWDAVPGAKEYNVYKWTYKNGPNGVFGFTAIAKSNSYTDYGTPQDNTDNPPTSRNPFSGADNYPSAVTYFQERMVFGNSVNKPETVWTSRIGQYKNFTVHSPLQDDDAVTFAMVGRQVNQVQHLLDLGSLVVMTSGGEHSAAGDSAGILTPSAVNLKQHSYNGSSSISPIVIDNTALYVQARGNVVRDLGFDYQADGYRGNDLTIFSAHLFDGYSIVDWAYQQIPHSIVWAVRADGALLGLTYVREQQIVAWHRHDFGGQVESVCSVPEGNEDALYLVIKRTVDGHVKRYIERMSTRQVGDVIDSNFVDCSLGYDGRNTDPSKTMTLSGGTAWTYNETLTLTCSSSFFLSSDVGNQIHFTTDTGEQIRFSIDAYTSGTVVTGKANKTVPVSLRGFATAEWSRAVDEIGGLWHLEGKEVSVFADGFVVASPNNSSYTKRTVADGKLALDKCYSVIRVGLPIIADLETLDIDTVQGQTLADKKKLIGKVSIHVESSRGIFVGQKPSEDADDPLDGLTEVKPKDGETSDDPVTLETGVVDVIIRPEWNSNGRVFIRQVDPLPLAVLAISPSGLIPFRG